MKTVNKLVLASFLFFVVLMNAQPPSPAGGIANKGNGTGAPSSPIDMYMYVLAIVAIMLIIFFSKKYSPKKI
ncbi:MAG: signal peptidase [Chryseobacterium taeanense]